MMHLMTDTVTVFHGPDYGKLTLCAYPTESPFLVVHQAVIPPVRGKARRVSDYWWSMTHKPTGLTLGPQLSLVELAIDRLNSVAGLVDWGRITNGEEIPEPTRRRIRERLYRYGDAN